MFGPVSLSGLRTSQAYALINTSRQYFAGVTVDSCAPKALWVVMYTMNNRTDL